MRILESQDKIDALFAAENRRRAREAEKKQDEADQLADQMAQNVGGKDGH